MEGGSTTGPWGRACFIRGGIWWTVGQFIQASFIRAHFPHPLPRSPRNQTLTPPLPPTCCRYVQYSEELHRVPLFSLSQNERLCLLLNLHNLAVCQLAVKLGRQLSSQVERLKLFSKYSLLIGGAILSVADIQQCIIHGLRKATDVIGSSGPRAKDEQVSSV